MATQEGGSESPEDYDDESPKMANPSDQQPLFHWQGTGTSIEEPISPNDARAGSQSPIQESKPTAPMQKRRRVTRACDECRRKKIKCDGKQPCTHCTVYSYDCTYDQPSNRRRNPAPQYIEAIENRMRRAEALLKIVAPEIDLNDPKYSNGIPEGLQIATSGHSAGPQPNGTPSTSAQEQESMLESMVQSTGSLDLDDRGHWDYHGHSSGMVFLRRLREQFGDMMGEAEGKGAVFLTRQPVTQVFDSPRSGNGESPMLDSGLPNTGDLPSKKSARQLCELALDDAAALMRFIHQPTFYEMFDRIYDTPPESFGNEENRYLPLLYAILAVGSLFAKSENSKLQIEGYENAIEHGFKYFKASRQMMDITDCRDIPSLQAVIFMIIFLQSSARLATCYSYVGIALRSALRMGMHRAINRNFNPIEQEIRKRIFWQIHKMDIYVGALLGLPMVLQDADIDQELPMEIDDEFITRIEILPQPPGRVAFLAATNAHTKLVAILQKVVKNVYPMRVREHAQKKPGGQIYAVSHARIREIEQDLQKWMEDLPMGLTPGGEVDPKFMRVQHLLRMAYAHVQMTLYRPFLHYVSATVPKNKADGRSFACAAACVSVSRNVIHITAEMSKRGLLIGAYWFTMYTTFFAILSLLYFVLENPDGASSHEALKDAIQGKDILASLAKRSMAADRCTQTLAGLFKQLPERLMRGRSNSLSVPQSAKKRSANHSNPSSQDRSMHSSPGTSSANAHSDPSVNVQRSSTFPNNPATMQQHWKRASLRYPTLRSAEPYRRNSDVFSTSSNADTGMTGVLTPESRNSASTGMGFQPSPLSHLQKSPQSSNFSNLPQTFVPDLSAMMFPSSDPFAYPNQPMTTLENTSFSIKEEDIHNPLYDMNNSTPSATGGINYAGHGGSSRNSITGFAGGPPAGTANDSLEVQLFGPLPSYMMHAANGDVSQPAQASDMSRLGMGSMAGVDLGLESVQGGMWGDQTAARTQALAAAGVGVGGTQGQGGNQGMAMGFEDVFGDDWKVWGNGPYGG